VFDCHHNDISRLITAREDAKLNAKDARRARYIRMIGRTGMARIMRDADRRDLRKALELL